MEHPAVSESKIKDLIQNFPVSRSSLIGLLQAMQSEFGYLPRKGMLEAANYLGLSPARVYGVATFYAQFTFRPRGRRCIKVCRGTACHVKGADKILAALEKRLGIKAGQTTQDLEYSLDSEACFGSCALAPLVVIDEKVYGKTSPESVLGLLEKDNEPG